MKTKERYIVGDEWLYYKIYTGPKTSDLVLTEIIRPLMDDFLNSKLIDKWFFIRYADPKNHIRLRMHLNEDDNFSLLIAEFRKSLNELYLNDLIWDVKIESYCREIRRYGINTMSMTEILFYYDSTLVLDFLNLINDSVEGEELRWLFSLKCIDSILTSFKLSTFQKQNLLETLDDSFGKEFNMSRALKKQLDKKYRLNSNIIDEFLLKNEFKGQTLTEIFDLISNNENKIKHITKNIIKFREDDQLQVDFTNYLGSLIHMTMNRIFRSKNRLVEMVCYNFLNRHYSSEIAKIKYQRKYILK